MAKARLFHGLTAIMASLLVISMGLSTMATNRAAFLNSRLGTSNYVIVTNEDAEASSDGTYFDSEFSTLGELVNAEMNVAEILQLGGTHQFRVDGRGPGSEFQPTAG